MQVEDNEDVESIPDELTEEGQRMSTELEIVTEAMNAAEIQETTGKCNSAKERQCFSIGDGF